MSYAFPELTDKDRAEIYARIFQEEKDALKIGVVAALFGGERVGEGELKKIAEKYDVSTEDNWFGRVATTAIGKGYILAERDSENDYCVVYRPSKTGSVLPGCIIRHFGWVTLEGADLSQIDDLDKAAKEKMVREYFAEQANVQ